VKQGKSDNTLIATIPKDANEELRIELAHYQGAYFVALRVWGRSTTSARHTPTHKGLTVPLRMLPRLLDALKATHAEARTAQTQGDFEFPVDLYKQAKN